MASQPHFSVKETTAPTVEPVDVEYVKTWLRIDEDSMDQQIADLIVAARQLCTDYTGRAFVNTGYTMKLDRLPIIPNSQYSPGNPSILAPIIQNTWPLDPSIWAIKMPRAPLVSVSSFTYLQGGQTLTLDPSQYVVDSSTEPGRLAPASGSYWPTPDWMPNSVSITFTAGYGATASTVPQKFRLAIVFAVGALFDNPNGGVCALPDATKQILDSDVVAEMWG